jgi:hypothetical protein
MTSSQTVQIQCPQKFTPISVIPRVELAGMNVIVNGKRHSLSRKGRAYRVIRAFFAASKPSMTTSDLMSVLDQEEGVPRAISPRARASRHSAMVRMMSRIREEFNDAFHGTTPDGLSWFHYDRAKSQWVLFKMPAAGADGLTY